MGFTSQDYLIDSISSGRAEHHDGAKVTTPAHTAGGWHLLFGLNGYPNPTTYPGTDLLFRAVTEGGGDGTAFPGIPHGGPVGQLGFTKHVTALSALAVAAAGAPWQVKLVDLEGYYRLSGANVTGTGSRVFINTNTFTADAGTDLITYTNDFAPFTKVRFTTTTTLPAGLSLATDYWLIRVSATTARVAASYADALAGTFIDITSAGTGTHTLTIQMRNPDGAGVRACIVAQTAPTGGGPNLTASSYTASNGTPGRAFQGSPSMGAAADAYATRIPHSGNAAGRYGPFLPLQGGDAGIRSIENLTLAAGTAYTGSGVLAVALVKPLADLILPATGALSERDLVNQIASLPKIQDGACLGWMLFSTGATTVNSPFTTTLDAAWG